MTNPVAAHVTENIRHRESRVKARFGNRVWVCTECDTVLGVFTDSTYRKLEINSKRVHCFIGGELSRDCPRCKTKNELYTRDENESIKDWLKDNQSKLAEP